jgi:hypothetical protein
MPTILDALEVACIDYISMSYSNKEIIKSTSTRPSVTALPGSRVSGAL